MIGVYGGAFDPVHHAHLRVALEAQEVLELDHVRMIPTGQPSHRDAALASAADRLRMLELAIAPLPALRLDDREVRRDGPSYTVDTLRELAGETGEALCMILGADAFASLPTWRAWKSLFDYAHVLVVPRPRFDDRGIDDDPALASYRVEDRSPGGWSRLAVTPLAIASRDLRELRAKRRSIRFLTPGPVCDFIDAERLYGPAESSLVEQVRPD